MNNIILDYLIFIISGLIIGSFLNVIILRFDDLTTIFFGRSQCPHCQKTLVWYELIPVLSFILLRAKCSKCQKPISWQYPLVEAGTAIIFALIFWKFGLTNLETYFLMAISCVLIVALVYDMLNLEISDWLIIIAAGLWIIYLAISFFFFHAPYSMLLSSFYGALALGGFLGLMVLISKEKWMGAGDIGLGALLGAIIGWPLVLISSFFSFFLGAVVGIILMICKISKLKDQLPFAPFLILGLFITIFWGNQILTWYTHLLIR